MNAVDDRERAVLFIDVILLPGATHNSEKVAGGGVDCQEKV
jgi:hypothetical protein